MKSKPDSLWDGSKTATESARTVLPKLARDFFREGREIVASSPSIETLHQLRLSVKRLRYSLEFFLPCYGNGLEQRLDALKGLQDHLGAMNDCAMAARLVESTLPDAESTPKFREFLKTRAAEEREAFLRHWQETFDAQGQERWWVEYLSRPGSLAAGRAEEPVESDAPEAAPAVLKKAATA
jgi:CHAD domain-containing protein